MEASHWNTNPENSVFFGSLSTILFVMDLFVVDFLLRVGDVFLLEVNGVKPEKSPSSQVSSSLSIWKMLVFAKNRHL